VLSLSRRPNDDDAVPHHVRIHTLPLRACIIPSIRGLALFAFTSSVRWIHSPSFHTHLYPPAPPVLYCLDSPRLFLIIMCIFIANRIYRIRCLIALDLRVLACLLQLCQYLSVSLLYHSSSPINFSNRGQGS
jgi:hypothetical protein